MATDQLLLKHTPAVIWARRAEGDCAVSFISESVRNRLGYAPEEFVADPAFWASHIHPEDAPRVLADLRELIERGGVLPEYRFRHRDGSWRWMHDEVTVVRDGAGRPEQLVGYWADVTARVVAERELERARERLQLALEGGRVAVWDTDTLTGEIYLSEHWAEMLGKPRQATRTTSQALLALVHPDDQQRVQDAAVATMKGERLDYAEEQRVRRANGEWLWIETRGRVTERAPGGRATRMSGTNVDISERKRAEAMIQDLLRAKSDFMASVAHELRTPLNSVIGFSELLRAQVPGPLNTRQAEFAADILAAGRRLLALVQGILELSRLDAPEPPAVLEPLEIGAVLAESVAARRQPARALRVSIALTVAPGTGSAALDPAALRRMVDVLIDNAVKFNREGGSVAVCARRAADTVEIAVADTGIGIAKQDLPKLFQPLVQLDASLSRAYGGIGLGLALARRLAQLHGGTIEVESEPGKGSTFRLLLPAERNGG